MVSLIRSSGFISVHGNLSAQMRASVTTVILRIGKRSLWTTPATDGSYTFTFASRQRLLWVAILAADLNGQTRCLRHLLIFHRPRPPITVSLDEDNLIASRALLEGAFDSAFYLESLPPKLRAQAEADPVRHYLVTGRQRDINPHPWFNIVWYLRQNPAVAATGEDPFSHYLREGWKKDLHPHPRFDNTRYLARHPQLLRDDLSPLHHWEANHRQPVSAEPVGSRKFAAPSEFSRTRPYPIPSHELMRSRRSDYLNARRPDNRIAVFTCITNHYDTLRLPEHLSPDIDYFVYSNQPIDDLGVFIERQLPSSEFADRIRWARYCKLHPHRWFPDYDVVIFIDANVVIRGDLTAHIDSFIRSNKPLAFLPHPARDCLYEEAVICAASGKDTVQTIVPQILSYQQQGYPHRHGLIETNVYACRPGHPQVRAVLEFWWHQLVQGSRRDQLSINYVLWQMNLTPHWFLGPESNTRNHPAVGLVAHGTYDEAAYAPLRDHASPADRSAVNRS